jgi:hypothetical protein
MRAMMRILVLHSVEPGIYRNARTKAHYILFCFDFHWQNPSADHSPERTIVIALALFPSSDDQNKEQWLQSDNDSAESSKSYLEYSSLQFTGADSRSNHPEAGDAKPGQGLKYRFRCGMTHTAKGAVRQ